MYAKRRDKKLDKQSFVFICGMNLAPALLQIITSVCDKKSQRHVRYNIDGNLPRFSTEPYEKWKAAN